MPYFIITGDDKLDTMMDQMFLAAWLLILVEINSISSLPSTSDVKLQLDIRYEARVTLSDVSKR